MHISTTDRNPEPEDSNGSFNQLLGYTDTLYYTYLTLFILQETIDNDFAYLLGTAVLHAWY